VETAVAAAAAAGKNKAAAIANIVQPLWLSNTAGIIRSGGFFCPDRYRASNGSGPRAK
jgi:hypothetical protein